MDPQPHADLIAGARAARRRYELYKAKVYGPEPTSLRRLDELQHEWERAESRLRRARYGQRPARPGGPEGFRRAPARSRR